MREGPIARYHTTGRAVAGSTMASGAPKPAGYPLGTDIFSDQFSATYKSEDLPPGFQNSVD
jgi:hypothetical protein